MSAAAGGPRAWRAVVLVLGVLAAACSTDDGGQVAPASSLVATTSSAAPSTTPSSSDWPTAGRDLANSRAVTDARIRTSTIGAVERRWRTELDGAGGLSTVPIVVDGLVYVGSSTGRVFALDERTGALRWASEPTGFNIGPFGVAIDDDHVYALDGSAGVVALDRVDGSPIWRTDVTATDTTGIDIQPIVVEGLVIVSSVPVSIQGIYAPGDRGVVYALDATSGAIRWSFDTVDGDLWGHPEVNSGGGAWYPPAVDVVRGLVYVGTANPAPFPGTREFPNASSRPGPNLYTNAVVALDLRTGELRWYHQVTPHDLFDRDQVHTLIAGDLVVSAGKSGVLVGLDLDDGTVRWVREVGLHRNDTLAALEGPTEVAPGTYGGVLTPPAYADGVLYAAVVNAPTVLEPDATAYFGADLDVEQGEMVAVDAVTGELRWSTDLPGNPLGGAAVVGDLVLTALLDGTVVALRVDDGAIVRSFDAGGGVNGWMSATEDRLYVPAGVSPTPALVAFGLPD
jgi:outer membrane protein assembly factor BamB